MRYLFLISWFSMVTMVSEAAYTIKDGKLINMHEIATLSVQEHYGLAKKYAEEHRWPEAIQQFQIVIKNFPGTPFAWDGYYYLGEAYYHLREFDVSNAHFSNYLKQNSPKFFEEALEYKFLIAQAFEKGERRRLMGLEALPKWMPGRQEAIELYDEVISALPQNDLAVQSLFGKATLLLREKSYKESIETFQTLIRRFPRHPLASSSYVEINKVYFVESQKEYPDPDYLDLAEINLRKFKNSFPEDPKIAESERFVADMKEIYASQLYETADFYERTKRPDASRIYYAKILSKYPGTKISEKSEKRLKMLESKHPLPTQKEKDPFTEKGGVLVDANEQGCVDPR